MPSQVDKVSKYVVLALFYFHPINMIAIALLAFIVIISTVTEFPY